MEVSENSQVENSQKDSPDDSGKVEVEVEDGVDSGEVNKDGGSAEWAVEVSQDWKEGKENVEDSRSDDVTAEEEKGKEAESSSLFTRVASELPVSDAKNVEASSGVIASVKKEPDADPYVPTSSGGVEIGAPEVSEIPRNTEDDQTYTTLSHQTRASWLNCCGLLDAFKGWNQ
ncbi:OLC1v1023558C1 [Oldenlandia corymbosa var. corymbosa]|uniref:OLC1v1023558C1 n=1 Tax=Oldenlandia corymbosa var. corymbosa TaxID=529605 RepID=A0AAV1C3U8_OLDCO|nr:OLC1v1023558C1 [Oldenlandia corymbosa var. corymbosa]